KIFLSPKQSEKLKEIQKEISKKNNEKAENSNDEESIEIITTNILKNINEVQTLELIMQQYYQYYLLLNIKSNFQKKLKERFKINIKDLENDDNNNINEIENIEEILLDNYISEDTISSDSETDKISNEPVIIRLSKHNLRKSRKVNYKETSKKIQVSISNLTETEQIIKKVLETIIKTLNFYWKNPNQIALISTILDPRYKDFSFLSNNEIKLEIEFKVQYFYDFLKYELNPNDDLSEIQ
ncbi:17564_t:CDS:2, partial [Funneliformis geosporum]